MIVLIFLKQFITGVETFAKEKYPEFVKEYMRYLGDGGTADV